MTDFRRFLLLALLSVSTALAAVAEQWYVSLGRVAFPLYAVCGEPFSMTFSLENTGMAPITSVNIRYSHVGGTPMYVFHTVEPPIRPGEAAEVVVDGFICDLKGKEVFGEFALTGVNGEPNSGNSTYLYLFCPDRHIPKRIVIEEGASVGCGYCPRGYVSMEHIHEKYTDGSCIGISYQQSGEMADLATFDGFWSRVTGRPTSFINRDYANPISPLPGTFDDQYARVTSQGAEVDVKATVAPDVTGATATVTAALDFVFDNDNADYRVAFIITEDGLGPYPQRNYYADSWRGLGEFYGWEDKEQYVDVVFNDIARPGSIYESEAGLLPSGIIAGEIYTVTKELDLSRVNPQKANVAVLVTDGPGGKVMNAVRVPLKRTPSAIADVSADDAPVGIYRTDGRRVAGFGSPGIYIVKQGRTTRKIYVR